MNPFAPKENIYNLQKVTPEHIQSVIVDKTIDRIPNTTVTIVTLHLKNGAKSVGINYGTINPEEQDWTKGVELATKEAEAKVYELENYLLRQKLWEANIAQQMMEYAGKSLIDKEQQEFKKYLRDKKFVKGVPIYSENSKEYFIKEIEPYSVDYLNTTIKTAPLVFGKTFSLIELSQNNQLLSDGVIDNTDAIHSRASIKNIYYSLNDEVISLNIDNGFDLNRVSMGNMDDLLNVNLKVDSFKVTGTISRVTGEVIVNCESNIPSYIPLGFDIEFYRVSR